MPVALWRYRRDIGGSWLDMVPEKGRLLKYHYNNYPGVDRDLTKPRPGHYYCLAITYRDDLKKRQYLTRL